jgi:hypothetical protein
VKVIRGVGLLSTALVLLAALGLLLSTSVAATAIAFGVLASFVTSLAIGVLRRELGPPRPAGPTYYITNTHQHLHVYPPAETTAQVAEPERRLEVTAR